MEKMCFFFFWEDRTLNTYLCSLWWPALMHPGGTDTGQTRFRFFKKFSLISWCEHQYFRMHSPSGLWAAGDRGMLGAGWGRRSRQASPQLLTSCRAPSPTGRDALRAVAAPPSQTNRREEEMRFSCLYCVWITSSDFLSDRTAGTLRTAGILSGHRTVGELLI